MLQLVHDVRVSLRGLRRRWAFTSVAIASLAFGIGGVVVGYSVVDATDFRPLPYSDPDRLVAIHRITAPTFACPSCLKAAPLQDYQAISSISDLVASAAAVSGRRVTLTSTDANEKIWLGMSSASLATVLGIAPSMGRFFSNDEEAPGHDHVVVLANEFWRHHFGGDPSIIGRQMLLANGLPGAPTERYAVIGVMPDSFAIPPGMEAWIPLNSHEISADGGPDVSIIVRLRKQGALQALSARLTSFAKISAGGSASRDSLSLAAVSLRQSLLGYYTRLNSARYILLAILAALLVVTMSNLAALIAAQQAERTRDFAIRAALGGEQHRLLLQPAVELTLISTSGAALGVLLAVVTIRAVASQLGTLNIGVDPRVDLRTLALTSLITILCAGSLLLFTWQRTRGIRIETALRSGRSSNSHNRFGVQSIALFGEVLTTFVVLGTSNILIRNYEWLRYQAPGYAASNLAYFQSTLTGGVRPGDVMERLRTDGGFAGTASLGAASNRDTIITTSGRSVDRNELPFRQVISDGFFHTLGTSVAAGREFDRNDMQGSTQVAVVNRAAAQRLWPSRSALGQHLLVKSGSRSSELTIVGVVADTRLFSVLNAPAQPAIYRPIGQSDARSISVFIRTQSPLHDIASRVAAATNGAFTSRVGSSDVKWMSDYLSAETKRDRFDSRALSGISVALLFLAGLGMYGLLLQAVTSRARDIAIQRAIGAPRTHVIRRVLRPIATLVTAGSVAGGAALFFVMHVINAPLGLTIEAGVADWAWPALIVLTVSVVALFVPLRRALGVDPATALRSD